jgi:hypothetical protein
VILDQTTIEVLQSKYGIRDIESRYESCYANSRGESIGFGGEVRMSLPHLGFERLIRDLFSPEKNLIDTRDVFSIAPMEIKNDGKLVYVAKYEIDKYPLDVVADYGAKLREVFEAEGCQLILMPKIMDVSILTVEQLTQMRDALTKLIQDLSYDNIIGF